MTNTFNRTSGRSPVVSSGSPRRPETFGERCFRVFGIILGPLLLVYFFGDRGLAYLHIPGTVLYIGELTLLVGGVGALFATGVVARVLRSDRLVQVLAVFMVWGLIRAIPGIGPYGVVAVVHDSALWYYGFFAIFFLAAVEVTPDLPARMVRGFSRAVPWLTAWLPIAFFLVKFVYRGPTFLTGAPLFSHKGGNVAVMAATLIAFVWLVPDANRSPRARNVITLVNLVTLGVNLPESRGGSIAAAVALVVGLGMLESPVRRRLATRLVAVVAVVGLVAGLSGISITTHKRPISLSEVVESAKDSVGVLFGSSSPAPNSGVGAGTARWREELWANIIHATESRHAEIYGLGFGINLAQLGGVNETRASLSASQEELRSAHNSHLDVAARMGLIGLGLWVGLWFAFFRRLIRGRSRFRDAGDPANRGLCEFAIVTALALLINAIFDPTFESAQVAAYAWTVFGFAVLLTRGPILAPGGIARHRAARRLRLLPGPAKP